MIHGYLMPHDVVLYKPDSLGRYQLKEFYIQAYSRPKLEMILVKDTDKNIVV